MNTRATLILVAVLVALGAYVYFGELGGGKTAALTPTPSVNAVWDVPADDVIRIAVHDATDQQGARLVKDAQGEWQIEAPITYPADPTRLNALTGQLARVMASRVITDPPADLAPFGLITPTLTIEVGLQEEGAKRLFVGDKNPQGFSYYAQAEGDASMYLVSSGLVDDLRRLITEPPRKPTPVPTFTATPEVPATATVVPTPIPTVSE